MYILLDKIANLNYLLLHLFFENQKRIVVLGIILVK